MKYILFDNTLEIDLPDEFDDLDEGLAAQIYTAQKRPQVIKTTPDKRIHITLSNTGTPVQSFLLPQVLEVAMDNFEKMNPSYEFYNKELIHGETMDYAWFDFKGFSFEGDLYYLNTLAIVAGKLYHISFMCPFAIKDEKKQLFISILKEMRDLSNDRN